MKYSVAADISFLIYFQTTTLLPVLPTGIMDQSVNRAPREGHPPGTEWNVLLSVTVCEQAHLTAAD